MAETLKAMKDLRIRNVSLHSRGKTESGTLYLTRHHVIFSYTPVSKDEELEIKSPRSSARDSPAHPSETPTAASSTLSEKPIANVEHHSKRAQNASTAARARPREVWVPYPMINQCTLRASNYQNQLHSLQDLDNQHDRYDPGEENDDNIFPPSYGTNANQRPSTDSAQLTSYASPERPRSPAHTSIAGSLGNTGRAPALRIRRRDFQMMAFHFHHSSSDKTPDQVAREVFYCLRERCCVESVEALHAFHFKPPHEEVSASLRPYDARREFARMGIGGKAAEGPGSAWRLTDINRDYGYAPTYPRVLCVPQTVSDNMLKYGGGFRSRSRIPALSYLHTNGGSITRSSQPLVGMQNKRNPQDERLVSAIFASHVPVLSSSENTITASRSSSNIELDNSNSQALDKDLDHLSLSQNSTALNERNEDGSAAPRKRIYGSTRRNLIVDARPKINVMANRAMGGGIEDASHYTPSAGPPVEKEFLNIANIHEMRKSLAMVVESFASSDYLDTRPNQELLRKSGWLGHISGMLDGAEKIARTVGLGGSHVLIHCSDGWDRTAQVAGLAEIMLDPHYRTLDGFITLVQKDFLSFGHKFNHRNGIQGSEKWFEIENERVMPSRTREASGGDPNSLNSLGSKAFSNAKNWFDKNKGNLFRQQNGEHNHSEDAESRPPSPPVNPLLHSTPSSSTKEDKEHKVDVKEIAPIFHQFLDAVYQMHYQNPNAFEFGERFLRRLLYHTHSCQYGEFLWNTEKDRGHNSNRTSSVWPHFISRRQEFINPEYVVSSTDLLLFPRRVIPGGEIEVRWWSSLFGRKDEDMNTARSLAPPDPDPPRQSMFSTHEPAPSLDESAPGKSMASSIDTPDVALSGGGESTPSVTSTITDGTPEHTYSKEQLAKMVMPTAERPQLEQRETDARVLARYADESKDSRNEPEMHDGEGSTKALSIDEGDPLGMSSVNRAAKVEGRLDFAAFARQNAFSDR